MEMSFKRNIASRGWHIYGKTVWQNLSRSEKLEAKKKDNEAASKIDPYAIAWLLGQSKEKINLFLLLFGIFQEIFRGLQDYF